MKDDLGADVDAAAAIAAGVTPEEIKLPGNIARGMVLFEMEDGSFGAQPLPMSVNMSADEALSLADRYVRRTTVDMTVQRLLQIMQAQAKATSDAQVVKGILGKLGRR